jgi:hypothetical protein
MFFIKKYIKIFFIFLKFFLISEYQKIYKNIKIIIFLKNIFQIQK